jgi:hypothetical protein
MCTKSSYILIQNTFERINYLQIPKNQHFLVPYCLNIYQGECVFLRNLLVALKNYILQ